MYVWRIIGQFVIHAGRFLFKSENDAFIEDFRRHVLKPARQRDQYHIAERYCTELIRNHKNLIVESPGAGSRRKKIPRTISEYARRTKINPKQGKILFHLVSAYKPDTVIEFGTSLGVSTMYLAIANPVANVITVEGNPEIAGITSEGFKAYNLGNVKMVNKLFDEVIDDLAREISGNSLVFIDGNHTYDATMRYFNSFSKASIIIFDDIRWSSGMMDAWNKIKASPDSGKVIDLFWMGIVFPGPKRRVYSICP